MSEATLSAENENVRKKVNVFEGHEPEVKERTKKMLMYLIIFAIVMMFGAFTSAYIVMAPQAFWVHPEPVSGLITSNIIIVISSVLLILAGMYAKKGNHKISTGLLVLTFISGVAFTMSQWNGWQQLNDMGFFVSHNSIGDIKGEYNKDYMVTYNSVPVILENGQFYKASDTERLDPVTQVMQKQKDNSTSILFLFIAFHAFHLLLGLIYLIINIYRSATGTFSNGNVLSLRTQGIYWHFMGILWLYLYAFLFIIY
ncbi:MAG: heme-copper oxidase subunit III [Flavobacteriales bacterium]